MDHQLAGERPGQMKIKRMNDVSDSDMADSIDNMTSDDMFLPQVTISESPRFDANNVKRETNDAVVQQPQSPNSAFGRSYRKLMLRATLIKGEITNLDRKPKSQCDAERLISLQLLGLFRRHARRPEAQQSHGHSGR